MSYKLWVRLPRLWSLLIKECKDFYLLLQLASVSVTVEHLLLFRDVDQVHDMMDDIAEQQEVAREISEAISNPVAFGQDIDEVCI